MRKLAIFELVLISLGCSVGGFFLWVGDSAQKDKTFQFALKSGTLTTSSLVVVDKYQTGGKFGQYYIILNETLNRKEILRKVSSRLYKKINNGEVYGGYMYGNDYVVPAFDMSSADGRWKRYAAVFCWVLAIGLFFVDIKVYRAGKAKNFARMEAYYQFKDEQMGITV